jgi:hypothetical protein
MLLVPSEYTAKRWSLRAKPLESPEEGVGHRYAPACAYWISPDNPCACNTGTFWWLWENAVVGQGNSGQKDHHGKELQLCARRLQDHG